ncbi:Fe-S cluster formation protein [Novosphingobium lubricantis]|jgi:NifU-like protein involved in Fe-S cluster formation
MRRAKWRGAKRVRPFQGNDVTAGRGLYSPQILAAAMDLVAYGWDDAHPLRGSARSRSCGSTLDVGMSLDAQGRIDALGIRPHACAVGQAAAAIFAKAAKGRTRASVTSARADIAGWLAGDAGLPDWPGISLIAPAQAYPARHGAILLAWDAALDALGQNIGR